MGNLTPAHILPERRYSALRFAVLQGRICRLHGGAPNSYAKNTAESRSFDFGLRPRKRYGRRAASKGKGRGRTAVGDRGEWSAEDLALLAVIDAQPRGLIGDAEAAVYFNRTEDAVRVRRARLRKGGKREGAGHD